MGRRFWNYILLGEDHVFPREWQETIKVKNREKGITSPEFVTELSLSMRWKEGAVTN